MSSLPPPVCIANAAAVLDDGAFGCDSERLSAQAENWRIGALKEGQI